jgi:hypothetical protein
VHTVEVSTGIHCPSCGAEVEWEWLWSLLPEPSPQVITPCCDLPVALGDLRGDSGDCFTRFFLRITNPDTWEAPADVLAGVERILGVPVVSVTERI